jgi:hypothetical protein
VANAKVVNQAKADVQMDFDLTAIAHPLLVKGAIDLNDRLALNDLTGSERSA